MLFNNLFYRLRNFLINTTRYPVESINTRMILSLTQNKHHTLPVNTFLIFLQRFLNKLIAIGIITSIQTIERF